MHDSDKRRGDINESKQKWGPYGENDCRLIGDETQRAQIWGSGPGGKKRGKSGAV